MRPALPLATLLAVSVFFAGALIQPLRAQSPIAAPAGWNVQERAGGATTFTPPNLVAGEVYSVTLYEAAPGGSKTLEAYLREFAGSVGTKAGQLLAPLKMNAGDARQASGTGVYQGPNGKQLTAAFNAFSFDGGRNIAVSRVLFSADALFFRYKNSFDTLIGAAAKRAFAASNPVASGEESVEKEPSPAIKAREEAAQAKRYLFSTAPGKGVKAAQIQTVLHFYDFRFDAFFGSNVTDEANLLLKDGTVHEGLPCPPDQLDVAASRAKEPKTWGKWRKVADGYQVSWAGKPWEELRGEPALPGAAQTRLEGRYAAVRTGFQSHQFWGVTFGKDGRFSRDSRGGVSTGNIPLEGGLTPRVDSTWDSGGSGTSISGGVGGATFKKGNPNGDRQGTYSIDGYTLILRYDNGKIARMPFFFRDSKRQMLWFEGDTLTLGLDD